MEITTKLVNPEHIYDNFRQKVATSYIKHEFRNLLRRVPKESWKAIDRDISDWVKSPELAKPRDFWNGFHGICMGFKLKIGLIYFVTAENVSWQKKSMNISDLWFGVELQQTKVVGDGKLPAYEVMKFYRVPKNAQERRKQLNFTLNLTRKTLARDKHPIIVVQKKKDNKLIYSVYDGNRRLAKAILQGKDKITAFVGSFTKGDQPVNYWIPTTILTENLYFARNAFERGDKKIFSDYLSILEDMISKSESAKYELRERALIGDQAFKDEVLKYLKFI